MAGHISRCSSLSATYCSQCICVLGCTTAREPLIKCHLGRARGAKLSNSSLPSSLCRENFCLRVCIRPEFSFPGAGDNRAHLALFCLTLLSLSWLLSDGLSTWSCSHSNKGQGRSWRMMAGPGKENSLTACVKLLPDAEEETNNLCCKPKRCMGRQWLVHKLDSYMEKGLWRRSLKSHILSSELLLFDTTVLVNDIIHVWKEHQIFVACICSNMGLDVRMSESS